MGGPVSGASATESSGRGRGTRHDPVELAMLALFGLLSLWVLAWLLGRAIAHHEVWTGADGLHASDQLQYIAWIRLAGHHVLIANPYRLEPTAASFLHPGFLLSGALFDLGLAPWLAYLLWKPVAVLALFLGARAYVHRFLSSAAARRAALALALFFVSTAAFAGSVAGADATSKLYLFGFQVELWPGTWLWGYSFTTLAVAAMPAALLLYERDRARGGIGAGAPALALLCSWLQPWQGATLVGIVAVSEALCFPGEARRAAPRATIATRLRLPALTLAAGLAPLAYYALLSRYDPSWSLAGKANQVRGWPLWALVATLAPLAVPAALAYRTPARGFGEVAVRVWPIAGLALYWVIALGHVGTFAIHAFQGLTIPLAVLAVAGVRSAVHADTRPVRWALAAAVAALLVPALVWKLDDAQKSTRTNVVGFLGAPPNPYFLTHGEADALDFLARDRRSGGVLTSAALGEVVPARTDRRTWVGLPSWTPGYVARMAQTDRLLSGALAPRAATSFVRSTGARWVLLDCEHRADVAAQIAPIVAAVRRFGCAAVVRVTGGQRLRLSR